MSAYSPRQVSSFFDWLARRGGYQARNDAEFHAGGELFAEKQVSDADGIPLTEFPGYYSTSAARHAMGGESAASAYPLPLPHEEFFLTDGTILC